MQVVTAPFWVWSQKTLKWPSTRHLIPAHRQQGFQLIGQVSPFSSAQVCPFQSQLRDDPPVEKPTATCNHYLISYLTSYMKFYNIYMALAFYQFFQVTPTLSCETSTLQTQGHWPFFIVVLQCFRSWARRNQGCNKVTSGIATRVTSFWV